MKEGIPLSIPAIQGNEWKYIKECLDTGWVSYVGSYVRRFEEAAAEYLKTKYAVATVNGTSALHVSLIACDIAAGDEVIVPALTFIAPANAVRYCGAEPVFMDCDPQTLCINVEKLISFIKNNTKQKKEGFTYNKESRRRIKAIMPVHIFGHPADMDPLLEICTNRNIDIVEDATESLGSEYKGIKTGSLGKIGCLSFNGNKIITTGGGGMAVTNNQRIANRIRHLTTQAKASSLEYYHDAVGYNYRLSNIQAAMGVAQMEELDNYIGIKRGNARLYKDMLSGIEDIQLLWEKPWAKSNFWFYTAKVSRRHKKPLMNYLLSGNIQVRPIWKLINALPMYKNNQAFDICYAKETYSTCFNLPCSVNLKKEDIEFIVKNIKRYFKK